MASPCSGYDDQAPRLMQTHETRRRLFTPPPSSWGKDEAPRVSEKCGNRARGKHVWGHDIEDLVFESLYFIPDEKAQPFDKDAEKAKAQGPLFGGTVMFGIGS